MVDEQDETSEVDWDAGVRFRHRYGNGLDVCLLLGIQAASDFHSIADIILDELEFRRHEALIDERAGGTTKFTLDDAIALIKERWVPSNVPQEDS